LLVYPEGGYPQYCYSNVEDTPCREHKQTLMKTPTPGFAQYPAKNAAILALQRKIHKFPFLPLVVHQEGGYPQYCYSNVEYTPCRERKQTLM